MKVVIIGGGLIGLAVGEELVRRGVRVDLIERSETAGQESSSAAAGILTPQGESEQPGSFFELCKASYSLFPEVVARFKSLISLDTGYSVTGLLAVAFSDEESRNWNRKADWLRQQGIASHALSADEVRVLEPRIGAVISGVFWPQAAVVDPAALVQGYAKLFQSQGGKIHSSTLVTGVLAQGRQVYGVSTSHGRFEGDAVINCAGAWAGFERHFPISVPCRPARGQLLQYETQVPLISRIVYSANGYLVPRSSYRLIAGSTVEYVGFDKQVTEAATQLIHERAVRLVPEIAQIPIEAAWAGLRPDSPDHLPILGKTEWQGLWMAAGHFRSGILLAPVTARLIGDALLHGKTELDLSDFRLSRFEPAPQPRH